MTHSHKPAGVHLVGSIPFDTCNEVFSEIASNLAGYVRRIPDGETGERSNWVGWQVPKLLANPNLEMADTDEAYTGQRLIRLREGADAGALDLAELGYADEAQRSYEQFEAQVTTGEIPEGCRFQVCLPTPLAPTHLFIHPSLQAEFEAQYERKMLEELEQVLAGIPHDRLSIQWDTAVEFALLEGVMPTYIEDVEAGVVERLVRLGDRVPEPVELGFHLCYGDSGHRHFCEPADASKLVFVANAVASGVSRPINWIHLPVPRERDDDHFFRPLEDLRLEAATELFLGLIHHTDGAQGANRRIDAAARHCHGFGVATECGFGRRPKDTLARLLEIHTEVSEPFG